MRPAEVATGLGDPSKAEKGLDCAPEITLDDLVQEVVAHDLSKAKQNALLKAHGDGAFTRLTIHIEYSLPKT